MKDDCLSRYWPSGTCPANLISAGGSRNWPTSKTLAGVKNMAKVEQQTDQSRKNGCGCVACCVLCVCVLCVSVCYVSVCALCLCGCWFFKVWALLICGSWTALPLLELPKFRSLLRNVTQFLPIWAPPFRPSPPISVPAPPSRGPALNSKWPKSKTPQIGRNSCKTVAEIQN